MPVGFLALFYDRMTDLENIVSIFSTNFVETRRPTLGTALSNQCPILFMYHTKLYFDLDLFKFVYVYSNFCPIFDI